MKLHKKEDGSITLEAAIFMPIFILFLVFLIFMIKFALTDIALNQAVSETAKQIATQAYPVDQIAQLGMDAGMGALEDNEKYQEIKGDVEDIKEDLDNVLGEGGFDDFVVEPAKEAGRYAIKTGAALALTPIIQGYLSNADEYGFIDKSEVKVTEVDLVDENQFIEITAEYDIKLPIPFITESFKIQKKAYERLWLGS